MYKLHLLIKPDLAILDSSNETYGYSEIPDFILIVFFVSRLFYSEAL